jgi:hypothetical protein
MDDKEAVRRADELQDRVLSTPIRERALITYSSESLYWQMNRTGQSRVYLAAHWANENETSGDLIGEWNAWPERPGFSPSFPLYRAVFAGVEIEYVGKTRSSGILVHKLTLL